MTAQQPEGWKVRFDKEFTIPGAPSLLKTTYANDIKWFIATEVELAYEEGKDAAYVALTNTASEALEAVRKETVEASAKLIDARQQPCSCHYAGSFASCECETHNDGLREAALVVRAQLGKEDSSKQ